MHRAHAFVIDDEFLVNAPDFHLPGQTAEGRRGLGLDVLGEGDVRGAGVGCLADGGAEEEVAEASEVGFFGCFACCCGAEGKFPFLSIVSTVRWKRRKSDSARIKVDSRSMVPDSSLTIAKVSFHGESMEKFCWLLTIL